MSLQCRKYSGLVILQLCDGCCHLGSYPGKFGRFTNIFSPPYYCVVAMSCHLAVGDEASARACGGGV